MPTSVGLFEDEIESRTRWWPSYGGGGFVVKTDPEKTYGSYIGDVYAKPKRLVRSATFTSLTFYKDAEFLKRPLKKWPSYSSLSPSHALPYDLRVPYRYIQDSMAGQAKHDDWYHGIYTPYNFAQTYRKYEIAARDPPMPKRVYYPYRPAYIYQLYHRPKSTPVSYVRGSDAYLKQYVRDRLHYVDRCLPYVHNFYERPSAENHYLRYIRGWPETFVGMSLRWPMYREQKYPYRNYLLRRRLPYELCPVY